MSSNSSSKANDLTINDNGNTTSQKKPGKYCMPVSIYFSISCSYDLTVNTVYGLLQANGTYTGTVGRLARREVDFSLSGFSLRYDRNKV